MFIKLNSNDTSVAVDVICNSYFDQKGWRLDS